jgi:hypothetical protein
MDQLASLRLQRGVEHLHSLGPRAVAEFLVEVASAIGGLPAIQAKLTEYQRLTPGMVRTAGGDRFPVRSLRIVAK